MVFFYRRCSRPSEIFIPKVRFFFVIVHKNFSGFSTKRVQIPFCPKNPLKISTVFYSDFWQKNCPQTAYLSHLRAKYLFSKGKMVTRTGIENLGALFVSFREMQKSPNIRHFRTIYKNSFMLFFTNFLPP